MGAFKLEPKITEKIEFKNGIGKVIMTIAKLNNGKLVFIPKDNCALDSKEQGKLFDFLLENL